MESVSRAPEGDASLRTLTQSGLRWLVLSLCLALTANLFALGFYLVGNFTALSLPLNYAWEFFLLASVVPGFMGFWRIRQGRLEYGTGHETDVRRGTVALVVGAVSATGFVITGFMLGFVYVPASAPLGWSIRAVHGFAPTLIETFIGLFLLLTIWRLGTGSSRRVAVGAFLLGVLAPVVLLGYLVPFLAAVPTLSSILWLAAYLLVVMRLRGVAPSLGASAAAS